MAKILMIRLLKSQLKAWFLSLVSLGFLVIGEPLFWLMGQRRGTASELPKMKHILVLRFDQIGDVVLTIPLLRELQKNSPGAHITVVVKPEIYDLISLCPYADEVLTFDWHLSKRSQDYKRRLRAFKFCAAHLWHHKFDIAIIPRWDVDWYCQTFIAYFSGARRRVGYSEDVNLIKRIHNHGYDRLLTQFLHQKLVEHEVKRSLDILREIGGTATETHLEVWSAPADDNWAQTWLDETTNENGPLIAFGPFVGNSALKQWPHPNFAALGRWLLAAYGGRILLLGGSGDRTRAQRICDEIGQGAENMAGSCSLPQTIALLKRCSLYVGDDSGPMHLASAAGIPVVALFGPSCPHRFSPWTSRKQLLWKQLPCSPCSVAGTGENHADCCTVCIFPEPLCIQSITVEEVQEAIKRTGFFANPV